MSVSHSSFGAALVKSRSTRSSWTGGPGLRFRPRLFEKTDQIPWSLDKRWTVFSPAVMPFSGSSSYASYGNPTLQRRDRMPEILRDLRQRRFSLAGHINNILAELRPISRGHSQHFPRAQAR